jgi:anti-anti-sigma factor
MDTGSFTVVRPRPAVAVVEYRGEQDLSTRTTTAGLLDRLVEENDVVVVDLSSADFIDSTFLHELLKADQQAKAQSKRLRLQIGTAAIVERALEISGVLEIIEHADNRESAIR